MTDLEMESLFGWHRTSIYYAVNEIKVRVHFEPALNKMQQQLQECIATVIEQGGIA
jgi:hypothetical protein